MTSTTTDDKIDPKLDLVLERDVAVPVAKVWAAWTQADLLKQWFTPKPWETSEAEIDLRPGGIFRTVMRGPDGEEGGGTGCILEVVEHERLVWTGVLGPGFRPNPVSTDGPVFTAVITFEDNGSGGTRYRALAKHVSPDNAASHAEMGFNEGWGTCLDQLVELMS
jgi:uncharacterized protein YndB with AHSA1/START domain